MPQRRNFNDPCDVIEQLVIAIHFIPSRNGCLRRRKEIRISQNYGIFMKNCDWQMLHPIFQRLVD